MREIVEAPSDRYLDEARRIAEDERLVDVDYVALPAAVGCVVISHQTALVHETMLEEQIDRVLRQVPRRRPVAARILAAQLLDRLVAAHQVRLFLLARHLVRRQVRPAVVADLVPGLEDRLVLRRIRLDREARAEEGALNAVLLQQVEDARDSGGAELAARDVVRSREAAGHEPGHRIEIEGNANEETRHVQNPFWSRYASRHSFCQMSLLMRARI